MVNMAKYNPFKDKSLRFSIILKNVKDPETNPEIKNVKESKKV